MKIDNDFKSLIPPIGTEEYALLETSILAEGCRDALVVWNDILLDGHNRYEICERHGIKFKTHVIELDTREAAKRWIILNQFSRRNLTPYQRAELALKLEPLIAAKAKEKQLASLMRGDQKPVLLISAEREPIDTRDELAQIAGVSPDSPEGQHLAACAAE